MTYKLAHAPYIRRTERAAKLSADVLLALIPLCIFSAVYYGLRPALLVLSGLLSALVCELIACLLMKRAPTIGDGSAAVTGSIIGILVSPISPYWLPVVGSAFAILIVKMPMGGSGRNLFNPAAAGLAIITLLFPGYMFTYPDPGLGVPLPISNESLGVVTQSSPASLLMSGGKTLYTPTTLLLGDFPGPIGATAVIILVSCGVFLFARRTISSFIILPYLLVCAVLSAVFPRISGGLADSVVVELSAGYLLFAGIFMLNDPVTSPRHWLGRIIYGVVAGLFVMLMRYFGRFEEGACFAVLLVNSFSSTFDRLGWYALNFNRIRKRRRNR